MVRVVVKDDTVQVHYTGKLDSGEIFDSSDGHEPLSFKVGARQVVSGFDAAVLGMKVGEEKDIVLQPSDAYGLPHDDLKRPFPRSQLPADFVVQVGDVLPLQAPNGQVFPATILEVLDDSLLLDLNHPLAGKVLHFHVSLVAIV